MSKRLSCYNTFYRNCPCKCCRSEEICNRIPHDMCQEHLDFHTGFCTYTKTYKIRDQLRDDLKLYRDALQQIEDDGYKDTDREFTFISSRYTYIKELLEKYF